MEHWAKIFFEKKDHKTCSKHVWTLLGTILSFFGILKIFLIFKIFVWTLLGKFFDFFLKIFEDSTLHGTLGKIFFRKKRPQNMFKTRLDTFGNDFGLFWNFENFLIFLKFFEDSTLHGTLGKNFLPKKLPQNMFKTRLDTFGNGFEHFWNFETFLIF